MLVFLKIFLKHHF